ncbi:hypothetical protein BFJ63_vAg11432 [Fusarium oxysporum f. sp. narcissi]|uniref:Uncharacterized protein n=1 Tax=Fusarium oxysporum f. sp. narcissi TaxID=451672 RepID=A0A4Q2VDL9_FUSOX|nr:hypothetical protein BFJ70_g7814 [Fusarium oxysporum]RYC85691.1 hypothetical protein BFJ63_vAg11432 [Fusarium oxysporum f. sp. narcissi]
MHQDGTASCPPPSSPSLSLLLLQPPFSAWPTSEFPGKWLASESRGGRPRYDEPSAKEDGEHRERGDTVYQHNPENRSPSPVQQGKSIKRINIKRTGLAVFDGYFSVFNLDDQSVKAQARWTNAQPNSDDHQGGPPRKKARTSTRPEQKNKP